MEPTKKDLEFIKEELDYIQDMAEYYQDTPELDENEKFKYHAIAMKCEILLKQ